MLINEKNCLFSKNSEKSGDWNAVGDEITGVTTFEFERIDDGDYKLVETTTPSGTAEFTSSTTDGSFLR